MGKRGPKPAPISVRKLRAKGETLERLEQKEKALPPVKVAIPNVPKSVSHDEIASALWKKLSKTLKQMRVITVNDCEALEGLCLSYSRAQQAEEHIAEHGVMLNHPIRGWMANPAVAMARHEWTEVRKFAAEFGLTPSSRERVRMEPLDDDAPNSKKNESAEDFLFKKQGRVIGAIGA